MNAFLRALTIILLLCWYLQHPIIPQLKLQILLPTGIAIEIVIGFLTLKYNKIYSKQLLFIIILMNATENLIYCAIIAPQNVQENVRKPTEV
jgi:hypothetical protein